MKVARLILHIGDGKTGSTAIQRCLRASREKLAEVGVLFPDPGPHDNHQLLFPHLHDNLPKDPVQLASLGSDATAIRKEAKRRFDLLLQDIAAHRPHTIVLSCENQFRPFPPEAMSQLTKRCGEIADRTEVFAYLRDPATFALSYAQQDVKKRPEFRRLSPARYRDVLEPYNVAGPGPLQVARFGPDALKDGDAVADFFSRLLPDVPPEMLVRATYEENTSISAEAMALLQEVFRDTRPLPKGVRGDKKALRKQLVACDRHVPGGTRPALHPGLKAVFENRCTDLDWLEATFNLQFPGIDQGAMPRESAEARYADIKNVADLCPVDASRKAALWAATETSASAPNPLKRLARRFGL